MININSMHIVYIIQNSVSKEIYYGVTENLKQRLTQHNRSAQKATTRKNGSWELVYAEAYKSKDDAILRAYLVA